MLRIRPCTAIDYDVAIAGAGPAGSMAAIHLARAGMKVALLDQHAFPRDKVCGDFVGPAAIVELDRIGLREVADVHTKNRVTDAALFLDGKPLISQQLPQFDGMPRYGCVIPRMDFDGWLLEAARRSGAELLDGHRVTGYEPVDKGVVVVARSSRGNRRLSARVLLGADGSTSEIARLMRGHPAPRADRIIAVRAYYEDIGGPETQADLYFTTATFPGYYWLFPVGGGRANVGLGMAIETVPASEFHLRELLLKLVQTDIALACRLMNGRLTGKVVGWPLSTYNPTLPLVADHVALIGDAAGLINPLNGEGIQYALQSARWVAETVEKAAAMGSFSKAALLPYERRVEGELRHDMALSRVLVRAICNRSLNPVWLTALRIIASRARSDPEYARIAGGMLAGLVPARQAISSTMVLGTLQQAAISMAISAAANALGGPARISRTTMSGVRLGIDILGDTLRHPIDTASWGIDLSMDLLDLGSQTLLGAMKTKAPVSVERSVRLRSLRPPEVKEPV